VGARVPRARGRPLELADIVRRHGAGYRAAHRLCAAQQRALTAIERCRTAALGGEVRACEACGTQRYVYHSCRNRHCPKCQTLAKERWLAQRRAELLPVPYFHLVFTLPHEVNALAQGNPRALYTMLFHSVSATLVEFGENPRWLGGEIAATLVLHTWGQTLTQHLHLHCLLGAGALAPDGHWIHPRPGFLFPIQALSAVCRGKFIAALKHAFTHGHLKFAGSTQPLASPQAQQRFVAQLYRHDWVVYAKPAFSGPESVLDYLGRYTHRIALSNHRLLSVNATEIRFRYKDYAHGNKVKVMGLHPHEFLRRFLIHVLPQGFMRIRHYGLLANRTKRAKLAQARIALDAPPVPPTPAAETVEAFWLRVANLDIHLCPHCRAGRMRTIGPILAAPARAPPAPTPA